MAQAFTSYDVGKQITGGISMLHTLISTTRASALCASLLIGFVFTGIGRGAPNATCTLQVTAGHSIQAAINDAPAGAMVCVGAGTYWENLLISKDGITLQGAGPGKTILKPPKSPAPVCQTIEIEPIGYE